MHSTTKDISELLSDFTTEDKGRVCSYIDSPNSIILTELLFDNAFKDLSPEEFAAVCSIFVTGARESDSSPSFSNTEPKVMAMYKRILEECAQLNDMTEAMNPTPPQQQQSTTQRAHQQNTASLLFDTRELGLEMVMPVLTWCRERNIASAMNAVPQGATVFPGNLARTLSRILNLLEQIGQAAAHIGDEQLSAKITQVEDKIKHGTLFVSSLHLLEIQEQRQKDLDSKM